MSPIHPAVSRIPKMRVARFIANPNTIGKIPVGKTEALTLSSFALL